MYRMIRDIFPSNVSWYDIETSNDDKFWSIVLENYIPQKIKPSLKTNACWVKPNECSGKLKRGQRKKTREKETDTRRISQRQKQVKIGHNTAGYQNYIRAKPK